MACGREPANFLVRQQHQCQGNPVTEVFYYRAAAKAQQDGVAAQHESIDEDRARTDVRAARAVSLRGP